MELFKLRGTIDIDNSEANKALKETSSNGEKAESKLGNAMKKIGSGALAVGKTVATGLAVGATALGGLTAKALSAAGELEQNMGGSEAVFAEHAGKMQETAKTAFSNMGLSTSDFLATANKMGALFQGAGFDIETSATMSSEAMQRAADVASIMGISTEDAMEAIAGAAKGNFTMMDNLGVAMNDTTLQAYALSKGIDKSTSEMTNQEKIGLAMEMFMEKTAYAAGNYAKENETLAGSLGTAKAALSNFISGAGSVDDVVTSFSNAAQVIVKNINELFPKLMTGITQLVEQIVPMIPPLLEQLLPGLIDGATGLINGIVKAMPQIVTALLAAVPSLINGITQIMNALIAALPSIVQALVNALPSLITSLVGGVVSLIVMLCTMLPQIIQPIIDALPEIIISIVDALMQNLPALIEGCVALIVGIVQAMPQITMALIDAMPTIMTSLVEGIKAAWPVLWNGIVQICTVWWEELKAFYGGLFSTIGEWLSPIWDAISNWFSAIWPPIAQWFSNVWASISQWFSGVWTSISNWFSNMKQTVGNVFNSIKNTVSTVFDSVKTKISNVVNNIKSTMSNVFNSVKDTVGNIFHSIKEKMSAPIEKARDTIKGIVDKIKGFFSGMNISFPNIKLPHFGISPSGWKIGDLLKGSIPKLSIDWYAKAMDNPMVMTQPTVFGYNSATGQLMGGGEAGSEVVSGTNTLMNMIKNAVAEQNGGLSYYLQRLLEILADYFPQVLAAMDRDVVLDSGEMVGALAVPMNNALGRLSRR